jgi:hypothetical protein
MLVDDDMVEEVRFGVTLAASMFFNMSRLMTSFVGNMEECVGADIWGVVDDEKTLVVLSWCEV